MVYNTIPPLAYTSMLKFTVDGRPSVNDIHDLFSTLISQVQFATHRYMFRNYVNSFISEDAITELGSLQFSKSLEAFGSVRQTTTTIFNMSRDMAKALIQQFLWTRLIENSVEPQNRTYRDKGIWRLTSKGLCVLQEFCSKTKIDIGRFLKHVDASAKLIFLIRIERLVENDRLNCKMKYLTCLFTIMIASLPLRNNYNNNIQHYDNKSNTPSMQSLHSRYIDSYSEDVHSVCSSDSESSNSSQLSRGSTFSDYFPHIQILPNDLLVGVSYRYQQQVNQKSSFQQQRALLQNMNPSSNKFKMRAIFSSQLCCDWLVEFCTVASTDEAESILTEFLSMGWITFYDERHRHNDQVESSKSIALNLTRDGMKVVVDESLEKYNEVQQLQRQQQQQLAAEAENDSHEKRYSFASSSSSNHTDSCVSSTFAYSQDERCNNTNSKPKMYLPPMLHTSSLFTPLCDSGFSSNNFDFKTSPFSTELAITPYVTKAPMNPSPPHTPDSPVPSFNGSSNSIKLKAVLNDARCRSLFRDFLGNNYCVENLDFWIDYDSFHRNCLRKKTSAGMPSSVQRQLLEDAYVLWETYLKPGASRELNIDHTLREDMAEEISRMVTLNYASSGPVIVISSDSTYESLTTILSWFDKVHDQICRLMSSDSIPKFIRTPEYKKLMLEIQQELQEQERKEYRYNQSLKKMTRLSIAHSDFEDFPPPPQRKLKETIYL